MIDIDKIKVYNENGLIPGPLETAHSFYERVQYCFKLKEIMPEFLDNQLKKEESFSYPEVLETAFKETDSLYGIKPYWVPVIFSNYKLMPWHGGCAWIFQMNENTPTSSFFQLRQAFKNATTYLGIYDRKELIAHELSHVGRMQYEEPQFEEILAYRSSESSFRRFFGPIVQNSYESLIAAFLLFLIFAIDLYSFLSYSDAFQVLSWGIKSIFLGCFSFTFFRLCYRQNLLKKTLSQLQSLVACPKKANAIIYRLTDEEIKLFSNLSKEEIIQYIKEPHDFRLEVIHALYF